MTTSSGIPTNAVFGFASMLQKAIEVITVSNVSQVFRVNKVISGKDVVLNHVANFHTVNELVNVNGRNQIRERYLCDFDINTRPYPNYRFDIDEVKEFFSLSASCFSDYYNLYLGTE